MKIIIKSCVLFVAVWPLTAQSELVTSTVSIRSDGTSESIINTQTAAAGTVSDARSATGGGTSGSGRTATEGISYVTLASHPGRTFIHTAPFSATGTASVNLNNAGVSSGRGGLKRDSRWRFDALSPALAGTGGTFQLTFRLSWSFALQASYPTAGVATSINFKSIGGDISGVADVARTLSSAGSYSESNTQLFTTGPIAFEKFGTYFDCWWDLVSQTGAGHAGEYNTISSTAQLWEMAVFDSNGNRLTRFVDFDWYEIVSATGIPTPMATEAMLDPKINISKATTGNLLIDYTGIIQQSDDLVTWQDVSPQPAPQFEISTSGLSLRFFRARQP